MSLPRTLEPEVMDQSDDAADYDAMDHSEVNRVFVQDLLLAARANRDPLEPPGTDESENDNLFLDIGTGTAQIPIELCRQETGCRILAVDLAVNMLELARYNIEAAGVIDRVQLAHVDAKQLPYEDDHFAIVMSNSIVHHIADPSTCLREAYRVVKPEGFLFFRDLFRPSTEEELEELVQKYAGDESDHARQLFEDSLRAALTVDEMRQLVISLGYDAQQVRASSDRHWTWSTHKPATPS